MGLYFQTIPSMKFIELIQAMLQLIKEEEKLDLLETEEKEE